MPAPIVIVYVRNEEQGLAGPALARAARRYAGLRAFLRNPAAYHDASSCNRLARAIYVDATAFPQIVDDYRLIGTPAHPLIESNQEASDGQHEGQLGQAGAAQECPEARAGGPLREVEAATGTNGAVTVIPLRASRRRARA